MLTSASPVREYLKSADKVTSTHLIITEWNMNKYQKISKYGVYTGAAGSISASYNPNDATITNGKTKYLYDDNTTKEAEYSEYFSSLASVFEPDRPDPGIVLLQSSKDSLIANVSDLNFTKVNPNNPRFYPFAKNRPYDYFNSGKVMKVDDNGNPVYGNSNKNGAIESANVFVVYSSSFISNKIVIKVQNHRAIPKRYKVEILNNSNQWEEIFYAVTSTQFTDGTLNLYYDGTSTWTTTETFATDLDEITTPNTQLKVIKGIRLKVYEMTEVTYTYNNKTRKYSGSLELIEISPRVVYDLTSYTESLSLNSSLSEGSLGLPVGAIVSSNGNITLSNETKEFLLSSKASEYNMLTPDVEFRIYQKIYVPSNNTNYTIPLKIMYSDTWDISSDFKANVSFSDKFKLFQQTKVMDMALISKQGIPLSVVILMLLDNCGITGYEFKKSTNDDKADKEDIMLKNFWCTKEQTLADVLQELAIGAQCAMYIDAAGKLNVLTKERITDDVAPAQSWSSTQSGSTDFWMVFDEKYTGRDEAAYISDYTSNVISSNEKRIDPVNDGSIKYHTYGIKRSAGGSLLQEYVPKELLEDIPANSVIGTGFVYETRIVWETANDNTAVLGAANLVSSIGNKHIYDNSIVGEQIFEAFNEEQAVKQVYNYTASNASAYSNVVIGLDQNDAYTFPDYSGFVLVDNEYIEYEGILYSINGEESASTILFSREDFLTRIDQLSLRSSIVPKGLIVKMRFKIVGKNGNKYQYQVIDDGRAQFESEMARHHKYQNLKDDGDILTSNRHTVILGDAAGNMEKFKDKSFPKTSLYYDFSKGIKDFKKVKQKLGLEQNSSWKTYLGYLKLEGAKTKEINRLIMLKSSSALTASPSLITSIEEKSYKNARKLIPNTSGSTTFDPYVYNESERFIYLQKIDLEPTENINVNSPDLIGTRMRLYTGRKVVKENQIIASTYSSIAGIGFAAKFENNRLLSGYFLEVESVGSDAKDVGGNNKSVQNNLRFYKVEKNSDGIFVPTVLATAYVAAATTISADSNIINDSSSTLDGVFEIEIKIISTDNNKVQFDILYGGQSISENGKYIVDKLDKKERLWADGKRNIFMFVRGDSQAIFENIYAAQFPGKRSKSINKYSQYKKIISEKYNTGGIPQSQHYLFKESNIKFYYNDFARMVRQVKEYKPRFEAPVLFSRLIDISNVNPQYMIKKQEFSTFGGELLVVNTSNTAIVLSQDTNLPLYLVGFRLEEITSGELTLADYYKKISEDGYKSTDFAFNKSVYGTKSFTLDNKYIQDSPQASQLMKWIIANCSRERFNFNMSIFPNPLIELGDKVKVFSKDKGYYQDNPAFGQKTFVVNDISYSIAQNGPNMTINLIEVGAK